jgi:hypothetical protein
LIRLESGLLRGDVEDLLEFGDGFEILGTPGRALDVDQLLDVD